MNGIRTFFCILNTIVLLACPATAALTNQDRPAATDANISFNFENASLDLFLKEVEKIFQVSFIYDAQVKADAGNTESGYNNYGSAKESKEESKETDDVKITFRTNQPFTNTQAWAVVDAFLNLAGLARLKISQTNAIFRITKLDTARKEALPSFIGSDPNDLPESGLIRYVYFLKNSTAEQMKTTIDSLKSKSAILNTYQDLNALIFTDQAYNIKMLMQIVKELDSACTPVGLSVLKLKEADAEEVAKLYEDLKTKSNNAQATMYGMGASKQTNQHFLQESNVFAEPRTNTLIIVGPPEANLRIEKFITTHIDTKLAKQRSSMHTIALNYIPAEQIASIFNTLASFGGNTEAAKLGGSMRGGEKYFNRMYFEAEKQSNSLIVRGEEEDFLVVKKIIQDLDKAQPQVAIEVLIVSLETLNTKGLSSQVHNPKTANVNFQTSGFGGTGAGDGSKVTLSSDGSLVSNLISLATGASVGATVLSLGKSSVWALLSIINKDAKTNILSNPFLVTTNKYPAFTTLGEVRRVVTETIQGSSSGSTSGESGVSADLEVKITPRINSLDIINLDINIIIENFTDSNPANGNKSSKTLHTNASVADGEVLAIGGLSKDSNKTSNSSVPILSKIPIIGNLFKSKNQNLSRENLIVFITPKIIRPGHSLTAFTKNKANFATDIMLQIDGQQTPRDPITKWLFKDQSSAEKQIVTDFTAKHTAPPPAKSKARQAITKAVQIQKQDHAT